MKNITNNVSVVVVTRRRRKELKRLLKSLVKQTHKPLEIIIVVNDDSFELENKLVKQFVQLPISVLLEPRKGIPVARNKGIKYAKGEIITFIDDDCEAEINWIQQITEVHKKYDEKTIIQGKSISVPKNNFYVQITSSHYKNWIKAQDFYNNELQTFDTKNLSFKSKVFNDKDNLFNEEIMFASDDIELGYRLRKKGFKILYNKKVAVKHFERTSFLDFYRQHVRFAIGEAEVKKYTKSLLLTNLIPHKKYSYHIKSFIKQEIKYLKSGKFYFIVKLFFVELGLLPVRLIGYMYGSLFL